MNAPLKQNEQTLAQQVGLTWQQSIGIAQVGNDLILAGRLEEARIIFRGMVTLNPQDSAASGALGNVLKQLGKLDEAKQEFTRTLSLDPKNVIALVGRGELRLKSGDKAGLDDLKKAIEVDPKGLSTYGKRAQAMVNAAKVSAGAKVPAAKVIPIKAAR